MQLDPVAWIGPECTIARVVLQKRGQHGREAKKSVVEIPIHMSSSYCHQAELCGPILVIRPVVVCPGIPSHNATSRIVIASTEREN